VATRASLAVENARAYRRTQEANRLKDEFLATLSHELRTPLNAIAGWVHVLQTGVVTDGNQQRQALDAIDRNVRIQTRLIEDLLDVSRMIQGRFSLTVAPLDLRGVIDAAVETIGQTVAAKDIAIEVMTPPDALPVIGDEHRLQQVFWNLLANAVKYTPRGGGVTIAVARELGHAVVRVKDSGEGIDPAFLPHVFEPFRQGASATMRSGLGLGLAIVRRLVDLHGGRITAESPGAGLGSTFSVSLPVAQSAVAAHTLPAALGPNFQQLHVLIAEDDVDSAAAVTAILKLHGCETKTAPTAAECLRITGEWPTDVLICDVALPDDDGYGLLRRLRALPEGERLPAIALTAYARPEDRAKALAAGFRAHLTKPLDPESLLKELSEAAKERSAA
ncbi:MAG: hybrid sensor histidine kinase/response regulator, partial [Vicinamibacterales bacterium]